MQDDFYLRLEQRFRGSESHIAQRLAQYTPLLENLEKNPGASALDLGCGRGEWLSLLVQRQWQVRGIDLNASMVERCEKQGFEAHQQDALSCLKALPGQSVTLISGFHIAEHIVFDELLEIIREAYRVLAPEGVLLLETPNPENLHVGAHSFYMDPSHRHPLPPQLLQFAIQEQGFAQVDIRRLNGAARPQNAMAFGDQIEWFLDANLDYVVFAQKSPQVLSGQVLDRIGEADAHALEFYGMAREYVEQTHQRIEKGGALAQKQQGQVNVLLEQVQQNEVQIKQHQEILALHQEVLAQLQSSGLMRLVRFVNRVRRLVVYTRHHGLGTTGQLLGKKLSRGVGAWIMARPSLQKWALRCCRQSPGLTQWLQASIDQEASTPEDQETGTPENQETDTPELVSEPPVICASPRSVEIYQDLNRH